MKVKALNIGIKSTFLITKELAALKKIKKYIKKNILTNRPLIKIE